MEIGSFRPISKVAFFPMAKKKKKNCTDSKIDSDSCWIKLNLDYNYTFPNDLENEKIVTTISEFGFIQ